MATSMLFVLVIIIIVQFVLLLIAAAKISHKKYQGSMVVTDTETKKLFSLEMDVDPNTLDTRKEIVLRVRKAEEVSEVGPRE